MSHLHDELRAAGFVPVDISFDGVAAWTRWERPVPEVPAYERYYDLVKRAMYAQVDLPVSKRLGCRPLTHKALMLEIATVVDCWRSASQVPPPEGDPDVCAVCGCLSWYCDGPSTYDDLFEAETTCRCYDEELGEPTCD